MVVEGMMVEEGRAALESALALLENLLDLDAAGALRLAWQAEADPAGADNDGNEEVGDDDNGEGGGEVENNFRS